MLAGYHITTGQDECDTPSAILSLFLSLSLSLSLRGIARKGLSPEFRATRLWRAKEKGPLWRFSAYFPVFKAKKGPRKICTKPWLPVIRA